MISINVEMKLYKFTLCFYLLLDILGQFSLSPICADRLGEMFCVMTGTVSPLVRVMLQLYRHLLAPAIYHSLTFPTSKFIFL